jgi:hypothetical protein
MKQGDLLTNKRIERRKTPRWVPLLITLSFYTILFLFLFLEPFSRITEDSVNYVTLNTDVMQIIDEPGDEGMSFSSVSRKSEKETEKSNADRVASTADAGVNLSDSASTKKSNEGNATPDSVNTSRVVGDTLKYLDFYSGSGGGGNGNTGILVSTSKRPTFMGGDINNFSKWFFKRLHVPLDRPREIVNVSWYVDENGNVSNIKVKSCSSPEVKAEIIRVMKSSPKWEPGTYNNMPSGFIVQLNVNFK